MANTTDKVGIGYCLLEILSVYFLVDTYGNGKYFCPGVQIIEYIMSRHMAPKELTKL